TASSSVRIISRSSSRSARRNRSPLPPPPIQKQKQLQKHLQKLLQNKLLKRHRSILGTKSTSCRFSPWDPPDLGFQLVRREGFCRKTPGGPQGPAIYSEQAEESRNLADPHRPYAETGR